LFGGKPMSAPEVRQAGLLFRLQRYGVSTARLLAFGQRQVSPWRLESFLLTEPPAGSQNLAEWLGRGTSTIRQRRFLLREIGNVFQRIHAAGCHLRDQALRSEETVPMFTVHEAEESSSPRLRVTVARVDNLHLCRRTNENRSAHDFVTLDRQHPIARLSRTDELRVILAYLGQKRLTPDAKRFVRRIESLNRMGARA
jgi:hypothetical protein